MAAPNAAELVCGRIKAGLEKRLGAGRLTETARMAESAEWVRVDVRFAKAGVVSARMSRAKGGAVTAYPELNIAVSDRPLALDAVDQLAGELAAQLR